MSMELVLMEQRDKARAEVERLTRELERAISERTPHDYGILKNQRDDYRNRLCAAIKETQDARAEVERLKNHIPDVGKMVRPEPSRLEIAAMIYAAFAGAQCAKEKVNPTAYIALKCADELLAEAAKGGAK